MRFTPLTAKLILLLILPAIGPTAFAQSSTHSIPPTHGTPPSKKYCHESAGFCFGYPSSWTMLGDVFNGNGVVVAPEQTGDRQAWDGITVALVAVPGETGDGPSLNGIIEQAAKAMREAGQNFETLQRRELTVGGNPAQMLRARYRENSTGRDWLEELVFIQGSGDEIYSVALKCAPEHLSRLEPAMKAVLASWSVSEPQPPAAEAPSEKAAPVPSSPSSAPQKQEEQ